MWLLVLEIQEAGRERQWRLVRNPCEGEWKEEKKITSCWIWRTVMPHCSLISLSLHSHLCSKWLNTSSWASSLWPPTSCLPHSLKPVVFSTLRWHRHRVHLSNYIHFQADVPWQSYKALTSLFLINQILPERNFSSSGFKRYSCWKINTLVFKTFICHLGIQSLGGLLLNTVSYWKTTFVFQIKAI